MKTTTTSRTFARRVATLAVTAGLLTGGMAPAAAAPPSGGTVPAAAPAVTFAADCAAQPFPDNTPGTAYHAAVRWAQCSGLVSGYSDGTFGMREPISRNETAQILFRYRDPSWTAPSTSPFRDLSTRSVFYRAVTWGAQAKVITGYADGTWRGQQSISRAHTAALLHRMTGAAWRAPYLDPFSDISYGSPQYGNITWLHVNGIAKGYTGGTFGVNRSITRAELVTMLYRLHQKNGKYATTAPVDYGATQCTSNCARYTTSSLNMRSGPGTSHSIITTIPQGKKVNVRLIAPGWAYVWDGTRAGWVSSRYLTSTAPQPPAPPAPTQYPLAVYGTLRNGQSAYFLLNGKTTSEVTVRVNGYGLWLRPGYSWWSFMIPSTSTDSVVTERMTLRSSLYSSTLREVDEWERYDPNKPLASQNYNRKLVTDRQGRRAWAYVAGSQMGSYVKANGTKIIGGDFLKRF